MNGNKLSANNTCIASKNHADGIGGCTDHDGSKRGRAQFSEAEQ
jgi:hypothetical protein